MACKGGFICGLFVGAIVGSAAGILCAPESGEQMRNKIAESTQDAFGDVTKKFDSMTGDLKSQFDGLAENLTDKFQTYRDQLEAKFQSLQNEVDSDIAEINQELEQLHNEEEAQRQNITTLESEDDK